jgi:hypothetical protein
MGLRRTHQSVEEQPELSGGRYFEQETVKRTGQGPRRGSQRREVLDCDALLKEIDVVPICTPQHLHADETVRAANAGKHIPIEKPICTSPEELKAMCDAVRKNKNAPRYCFTSSSLRLSYRAMLIPQLPTTSVVNPSCIFEYENGFASSVKSECACLSMDPEIQFSKASILRPGGSADLRSYQP